MSDSEGSPVKVTTTGKAKPAMKRPPAQHPSFADMVIDAVKSINDTKGASVPGIRNFVLEKYKAVDPNTMKYRLKQALTNLVNKETLVRSKASAERPLMSSRFRMNKVKLAKESKPKKVTKKEDSTKPKPKKESATKVKKTTKAADKKSPKKKSTTEKVKKTVSKSPKTKAKKTKEPKVKPKKTPTKVTAKMKPKTTKTPKKTKTASKTAK